jgi:hypothetical protein
MPRDEIQTGNPGGVSNRPAQRRDDNLAADFTCAPRASGNYLLRPMRNIPALLSATCGFFAFLIALSGLIAAKYGGPMHDYLTLEICLGFLVGVLACLLAVTGGLWWLARPAAGGLPWAAAGLVGGATAAFVAFAAYAEALSYGC